MIVRTPPIKTIFLRLNRPDIWLSGKTKINKGKNTANPTNPRAAALWIRSYICYPIATNKVCKAREDRVRPKMAASSPGYWMSCLKVGVFDGALIIKITK